MTKINIFFRRQDLKSLRIAAAFRESGLRPAGRMPQKTGFKVESRFPRSMYHAGLHSASAVPHNPPPGKGQLRAFSLAATGMMQPQTEQLMPS